MKALALVALLAACDDTPSNGRCHPAAICLGPDAPGPDILVSLRALPGVMVTEQPALHAPPGYRYFVLEVTQPVDHANPNSATFQQEVSLIHRDVTAPMVALTTGYDDYFLDHADESTQLLGANQISIEHRFFGSFRPIPADWTKLTIAQMADDEHAIITLLKPIYGAAWIATGASKGGMTATYLSRFYPDDIAGTLAYVAPLSFAIPDPRYAPQFATIGTQPCRDQVKALATELLANRRTAIEQRAQAQAQAMGYAYTRIALGPAVESAIRDLEWTYWQYYGLADCGALPATTATDDDLFAVLDHYSPINFSDDASAAAFEAYFYQAYAQLGSPGLASMRGDTPPSYLAPSVMYAEPDYAGTLPLGTPIPTYDPAPMLDIDQWVRAEGAHLIFVYGQDDPWSGGMFRLGNATDALELVVAGGTHGADLRQLAPTDQAAALAKLEAWTGVTPSFPAKLRARPRPARRLPL